MRTLVLMLVVLVLTGCASSHIMVGNARAPIPVSEVKIYLHAPAKYEEIAIIDASSKASFSFGDQAKMEKVIARLKEEAASLGANGILFQGEGSEASAGTVYTGATNGNMGFGVGVSPIHKKASGIAIFVPEDIQRGTSNTVNSTDPKASQRILDLQSLKDKGLITDSEYQQKRKQILESL